MADTKPLKLAFNGVNGSTGRYLTENEDTHELAMRIVAAYTGQPPSEADKAQLKDLEKKTLQAVAKTFGVKAGVDRKQLSQTGWGIVFAADDADNVAALKEALQPLLDLRKQQAGKYYREYTGADAYRPGEGKADFLARFKVGRGDPADPEVMPYYLLIVGSPEKIPFVFQYQLDVQYAVGRLYFDPPDRNGPLTADTLEKYARYAKNVVAAETGMVKLPRRATFFGVRNQDDDATALSSQMLVGPLAKKLASEHTDWQVDCLMAGEAKKAALKNMLNGKDAPAFLFTASHGMGFDNGDPRQVLHQGGLLCADWPGPLQWFKEIPPDFYLAADDVTSAGQLLGTVAFHFACYGAGTPQLNDFAHANLTRDTIAPFPFVARLPQQLLNAGALAVVGHVERAWGYSFTWDGATGQRVVFDSAVKEIAEGYPVGATLEYFNGRYATLSTDLNVQLEDAKFNKLDEYDLVGSWTANNDARSYVVVGDPAVRLPLADAGGVSAIRPAAEPVVVRQPAPVSQPIVPAAQAPTTQVAPVAAGFGVGETLQDAQARLSVALDELTDKLIEFVHNALSIDVRTYVSVKMADVDYVDGKVTGAQLGALTHIEPDGRITSVVPAGAGGGVDEAILKVHNDAVTQARANREALLKLAALAAKGVLDNLKPG